MSHAEIQKLRTTIPKTMDRLVNVDIVEKHGVLASTG